MSLKAFVSTESFSDSLVEVPKVDGDGSIQETIAMYQTPETSDAEAQLEDTSNQFDETLEATASLEAYIKLLEASENGISAESAQFMKVGLESYSHLFEPSAKLMPSLESFGGTGSRLNATTVSVEDLKERVSDLGSKAKELLAKLLSWAKEVYENYITDLSRLQTHADKLKQQLASVGDGKTGNVSIAINNPNSLKIGGKFDPDDLGGIRSVATWAAKNISSLYREGAVNAFDKEGGLPHTTNIYKQLEKLTEGRPLLGNVRFEAEGFGVKTIIEPPSSTGPVTWTVRHPRTLAKDLNIITGMINSLAGIKDAIRELDKITKATHEHATGGQMTQTDITAYVKGPLEVVKYLRRTFSSLLAVIGQEIKAHEAAPAK